MPAHRYVVVKSQTTDDWQVMDNLLLALVCYNIPTEAQAARIRAALVAAWWDGANAVKTGEVIL